MFYHVFEYYVRYADTEHDEAREIRHRYFALASAEERRLLDKHRFVWIETVDETGRRSILH
jgi:hypothetical protein